MAETEIYVNQQLDGYTCQLSPESRAKLGSEQNGSEVASSIFVSFDSVSDFQLQNGAIWKHIVEMLTGHPPDQLLKRGKIAFVNPVTQATIFEPKPQHV